METIIDKLDQYRDQRHGTAQLTYSQILQRFDAPLPGDGELLDKVMVEMRIDRHHLENDVHLIQRYRAYLKDSESAKTIEAREHAKKDAEGIRAGSKTLFLALEK